MTRSKWGPVALIAVIALGAVVRANVIRWSDPWEPHHPDEHILPLEALALWEGVTPREVGWPASTMRVTLSVVEGAELIWQRGGDLWRARRQPDEVMQAMAEWIGQQFVHPSVLFKTGRTVVFLAGIAQLAVLAWALSHWTGWYGTLAGTLAAAVSPLAVEYSQYVLADMAGLVCATAIAGLAAVPNERRLIAMSALAGLATASKFHYGLWFLVPLIAVWTIGATARTRLWLASLALMPGGLIVVAAVPWIWIDPPLAAKELLGVVGSKVVGEGAIHLSQNALTIFNGLGTIVVVGMIGAFVHLRSTHSRPLLPLVVVVVAGAGALMSSGVVFERYALVVVPAALVITAIGWQSWLDAPHPSTRLASALVLLLCVGVTATTLVRAQRMAGETDVDVLVRDWILAQVAPDGRVAIHDEMNAFIPREPAQLRECAAFVDTPAAYRRKWTIEGIDPSSLTGEPMRAMLLTDEQFEAYWCRRELLAQHGPSYHVIRYHDTPRFDAILERIAVAEFASGSRAVTGGIDVLVTNRDVDVGVAPVQVFVTARGRRVIYRRAVAD